MEKLQFKFTLLPGCDGKSNVLSITSISTQDNKEYYIPEELQAASNHDEIVKTATYVKIRNSIKKRYQTRKVWINMTEELTKVYIDNDGNLQFKDLYLEEGICTYDQVVQENEKSTLQDLFQHIRLDNKQDNIHHNLKHVADKFIIERFTTKNSNAQLWINTFERECERFDLTSDEKRIEILRFFLDKSSIDWYTSMIIKLTLNSEWSTWKSKFCETFAYRGWNPVNLALAYKYKEGSLLDYAIRKEKLLLEMRVSIDTGTLIDLIAVGLPENVLHKIDREVLTDTIDLFNEIRRYEHVVQKRVFTGKKIYRSTYRADNSEATRSACKICENLNKGLRYHPEALCWFKTRDDKRSLIRHVNNSVIEAELNETEQKN